MTTENVYLVDVLARVANIDTSVARRAIVEGGVKINDKIVDDPAATLVNEHGIVSAIEYSGIVYPYYP